MLAEKEWHPEEDEMLMRLMILGYSVFRQARSMCLTLSSCSPLCKSIGGWHNMQVAN